MTLLIYIPVYQARFVWDDNAIIQNEQLRSLRGLFEIWFVPGSSNFEEHYWPVTYTLLWIQYQLWGAAPAGYHIVNVLFHALNSILLYSILRRLHVTGALLAALLFSCHPVHVESVAWAIEIKDVLSACFYLGAMLLYIGRQEPAGRARYIGSLICFAAALMSKSVVVTFPAAILLLEWYRGRSLKKTGIAVAPFVLIGVFYLILDLWLVRYYAQSTFHLTVHAKALIAGRAFWFYLQKLAWPYPLVSIYPQWLIDTSNIKQYLYPAAAILAYAGLFLFRRELGRGVTAALAFYVLTLAPTLGFVEFSFMKHSYVADRYQYLALAGPLTLLGACMAGIKVEWLRRSSQFLLILLLSSLTFSQARHYKNIHSLFVHTLRHNPKAWVAHYGLGESYMMTNHTELLSLAEARFQGALEIFPHHVDSYVNLALVQEKLGKTAAAIRSNRMALQLDRKHIMGSYNLARLYLQQNELEKAEASLRNLTRRNPGLINAYKHLGDVLLKQGDQNGAREQYETALKLSPQDKNVSDRLRQLDKTTGK